MKIVQDDDLVTPAGIDRAPEKGTLLLLTLFFGWCGAHKWYLKRNASAVIYGLFAWTLLPALYSLLEFFFTLCQSESDIRLCHPRTKAPLASVANGLGVAMSAGLALSVIVVPLREQFLDFSSRGQTSLVERELREIWGKQGDYEATNFRYAPDLQTLGYEIPAGMEIVFYSEKDNSCYRVRGKGKGMRRSLWINCDGKLYSSLK